MLNPEEPIFYTYLILDPRHKGTFIYDGGNLVLSYLPIYTGKGCFKRCYDHLKENTQDKNYHKKNIIKKIRKVGLEPKIIKILENVDEQTAFDKEVEIIWVVGRDDLNMGPLTNKTWGGSTGGIRKIENLKGLKFNRLRVIEYAGKTKNNRTSWLCGCDCGNEKIIQGGDLKSGNTKSCGCLNKELIIKSNKSRPYPIILNNIRKTPVYRAWISIRLNSKKSNGKMSICDRLVRIF